MAKKIFCDACGKETNNATVGIKITLQKVGAQDGGVASFYVEHSGNGAHADICKYCIIDAFKKLDDRLASKGPMLPRLATKGPMLPRLATIEMVSSVPVRGPGEDWNAWLQRAWATMYDAAINGRYIPASASAEAVSTTASKLLDIDTIMPKGYTIVPIELTNKAVLTINDYANRRPEDYPFAKGLWDAVLAAFK